MTLLQNDNLTTHLTNLESWLEKFPSALIAYSGGVDSALVMTLAHRTLHKSNRRALACIAVSPSYPERELKSALDFATGIGAQVRIVNTEEHLNPNYAENPHNRCYFCKTELYSRLTKIAQDENFSVILDGNNATDLAGGDGERPGHKAAREHHVRSPLAELNITKDQVRELAKFLNLPVWNKPAMPCTSSRVPHGTPIVPTLLKQIESAESALLAMGFTQLRVRHHGDIARIELPPKDFLRATELHQQITAALKRCGYKFITLDLAGFQSGSLHNT
jgi:uncharacterized protein